MKKGHLIKSVDPGSIAEEMELEPGDVLLTIDGDEIEDIFDYEYSYFIGKEAAGQIISYVQKHSTETKSSTSLPTISGTVTEIGNGYIMVDDTVLCKKSKILVAK